MNNELAKELREAATADGLHSSQDLELLERYIAEGDEDAARGLIWECSEE